MDWFLEQSVNVFPSLLSALSKSRLFKAEAKRDTALKRAFKEKKGEMKVCVYVSVWFFFFFFIREKYQFWNTAVNVFEYHRDAYGWVSFLQMLLHMFFFFFFFPSHFPANDRGWYLWWASFSYNWIEALPTARQDLVKLKVLLDCCYLCADSVTAVTTAAACQGLSPRIPPLITVFIGN